MTSRSRRNDRQRQVDVEDQVQVRRGGRREAAAAPAGAAAGCSPLPGRGTPSSRSMSRIDLRRGARRSSAPSCGGMATSLASTSRMPSNPSRWPTALTPGRRLRAACPRRRSRWIGVERHDQPREGLRAGGVEPRITVPCDGPANASDTAHCALTDAGRSLRCPGRIQQRLDDRWPAVRRWPRSASHCSPRHPFPGRAERRQSTRHPVRPPVRTGTPSN